MEILQLAVFGGLIIGVVYALAGASMVVLYRTSGYVSFAQGDIAAASLFVGLILNNMGMPYLVVAAGTILTGAILGGLIGSFIVVPLERLGAVTAVLATIAVGMIIQGGEMLVFGAEPKAFPSAGDATVFTLGALDVSVADVVSVVTCALVFAILGLAFGKTSTGIAMRAVNDSPDAAQILGVRAAQLRRRSWVVSGALAGVAGLFIAPTFGLTPFSVNAFLIFAFCAVVVGGFESIVGALVAGIGVGVISNLVAVYFDVNLVNISVYIILLLVLLVRPHGLFGRRPLERV